jgi:hypothetical protein
MTLALDRPLVRSAATLSVGLVAALALPYLVHLLPADGGPPQGARLLPIFYAGLVLALRGATVPALAVAVLAPLLNRALTGMPSGPMLPTLMTELLVFTVLLVAAVRYVPRAAPYLGPVAYLVAATIARPLLVPGAAPLGTLTATIPVAWIGLIMILAVGIIAGFGRDETREPRTSTRR